jgi:hypothetical protein
MLLHVVRLLRYIVKYRNFLPKEKADRLHLSEELNSVETAFDSVEHQSKVTARGVTALQALA